jgi:type IV pilus assembly protein PilB
MHSSDAGERLQERKIGSVLLSKDMITEEQLEEPLEVQKTDERRIGELLISLGYLSHEDLARALSTRLNVEYVDLAQVHVDPDVLGIISE